MELCMMKKEGKSMRVFVMDGMKTCYGIKYYSDIDDP